MLAQLFFSIEISCQICKQIIENNYNTNAQILRLTNTSKVAEDLIHRCVDSLELTVQAKLEVRTVDEEDPFNQFMQVVDQDQDMKEVIDEESLSQ